jgi:hypothetical protein
MMPGGRRRRRWDWSWRNGTTLGFHLTLNPQPPVPPSAAIYRQFLEHGIVVRDSELESILRGREEGIQTISGILRTTAPSLGPDLNLRLSTTLADTLLMRSLRGQLSRESPTALERIEERDATMRHLYNQFSPPSPNSGFLPQLFESLPPVGLGFSLTIHFP